MDKTSVCLLLSTVVFIVSLIVSIVLIIKQKPSWKKWIQVSGYSVVFFAMVIYFAQQGSSSQQYSSNKINSQQSKTISTSAPPESQNPSTKSDIVCDASEAVIVGDGLELIDFKVDSLFSNKPDDKYFTIIGEIRNNSKNMYGRVDVAINLHNSSGSVVESRGDLTYNLEPGNVWKFFIPVAHSDATKVKLVSIKAIGTQSNTGRQLDNKNELVINCAKTLILKQLKAPGSARWVASEVLEKDNYGRYLVRVVVDAQNSFGALLRREDYVILQSVSEDGHFTYNPGMATVEQKNYSPEQTILLLKEMNDWNKPIKQQNSQ